MRLARAQADDPAADGKIAAHASAAQLDVLQLDYQAAPHAFSNRFFDQFRQVHKFFFLEPSLRLITNAGGGATVPCVEALAKYLREHGDEDMLITAVRGDNLLSRLEELAAEGVEFMDRSDKRRLLSAQVELGAGPLATAWEEGSRIIVAGCYDAAAPFVAALASELALPWDDYDALAMVALASSACSVWNCVAEIDEPASLALEASGCGLPDSAELLRQLKTAAESNLNVGADVVCDLSAVTVAAVESFTVLQGARGREPAGDWRLRLTYAADDVLNSPRQEVRWARVPRDAVRVAVDTRPAREWF